MCSSHLMMMLMIFTRTCTQYRVCICAYVPTTPNWRFNGFEYNLKWMGRFIFDGLMLVSDIINNIHRESKKKRRIEQNNPFQTNKSNRIPVESKWHYNAKTRTVYYSINL